MVSRDIRCRPEYEVKIEVKRTSAGHALVSATALFKSSSSLSTTNSLPTTSRLSPHHTIRAHAMAKPDPPVKLPAKASPLVLPELLESITMFLSLHDILLCQRVNTNFRDIVQRSSSIKKVLFLKPATNETVEIYDDFGPWEWQHEEGGEPICPLFNSFLASYERAVSCQFHSIADVPRQTLHNKESLLEMGTIRRSHHLG